jgi:hypothetical protein
MRRETSQELVPLIQCESVTDISALLGHTQRLQSLCSFYLREPRYALLLRYYLRAHNINILIIN